MDLNIPLEKRIVDAILLTMPLDKKRTADMIVWLALHKLYQPKHLSNTIVEQIITEEIQSWME